MHNRQSNKQVFFSLEFVNILLQIEAKAVKNASSLLYFSGHSELENGLFASDYRAIALGSKPPLVAQRAQTGLGTRLGNPVNKGQLSLSCQKAHIPYK